MDASAYPRKKPRNDFTSKGNGTARGYGFGTPGSDMDLGANSGSSNRTKAACTKFFSTYGCPYGEECHFSHFVVGGLSALSLPSSNTIGKSGGTGRKPGGSLAAGGVGTPSEASAALGGYKTRLCNKFGTGEGCRFGENCHFAHGEKEMQKGNGGFILNERESFGSELLKDSKVGRGGAAGLHEISRVGGSRGLTYHESTPPGLAAAASFGASSTAKISIDASLAGAIIGKSGINAKQICRLTGAKLAIRDHETDPKLKNVEMEGSFDQIKLASQLVRELLVHKDVLPPPRAVKPTSQFGSHNLKAKMCENFPRGTCTFGERCHFAHGAHELRDAARF